MLLLVAATFWHLKMGLKVVVEDYVHDEGNKFLAVLLLTFAAWAGAAFALFAVLKVALGAGVAAERVPDRIEARRRRPEKSPAVTPVVAPRGLAGSLPPLLIVGRGTGCR